MNSYVDISTVIDHCINCINKMELINYDNQVNLKHNSHLELLHHLYARMILLPNEAFLETLPQLYTHILGFSSCISDFYVGSGEMLSKEISKLLIRLFSALRKSLIIKMDKNHSNSDSGLNTQIGVFVSTIKKLTDLPYSNSALYSKLMLENINLIRDTKDELQSIAEESKDLNEFDENNLGLIEPLSLCSDLILKISKCYYSKILKQCKSGEVDSKQYINWSEDIIKTLYQICEHLDEAVSSLYDEDFETSALAYSKVYSDIGKYSEFALSSSKIEGWRNKLEEINSLLM